MTLRYITPMWGLVAMCALGAPAFAQPKKKTPPPAAAAPAPAAPDKDKKPKEKTFDFNGVNLNGQNRTPQLLYFLERANEELERASLEKRSFISNMTRSIDQEQL